MQSDYAALLAKRVGEEKQKKDELRSKCLWPKSYQQSKTDQSNRAKSLVDAEVGVVGYDCIECHRLRSRRS